MKKILISNSIDEICMETLKAGKILIFRNFDKPGMLASVSRELSIANINIGSLSLGRLYEGDHALTVISIDSPLSEELKKSISSIEGIKEVYTVTI
ncbi:MAG: ACT domain-containing protein [Ignavibacteriaceae bacterium]